VIQTAARAEPIAEPRAPGDPHLLQGAITQRRQLARLTAAERVAVLLERYPELKILPSCDWQRLGVRTVFSLLHGASSRHFARVELAALAGIVTSAGVSTPYMLDAEHCVRSVLNLIAALRDQHAARDHAGHVGRVGP
jgi:hypothetical protein